MFERRDLDRILSLCWDLVEFGVVHSVECVDLAFLTVGPYGIYGGEIASGFFCAIALQASLARIFTALRFALDWVCPAKYWHTVLLIEVNNSMGKKKKPAQPKLYIVKAVEMLNSEKHVYVDPVSKKTPFTDLKAAHQRANEFAAECRQINGRGFLGVVDWVEEN